MKNNSNKNIGLFFNAEKREARVIAERLIAWGEKQEIEFLLLRHEAKELNRKETKRSVWFQKIDFAVVIGGDGTFLRAARTTLLCSIPLYGINVGHLGFLVPGCPDQAESDILAILDGKANVLDRVPLLGRVQNLDGGYCDFNALNEFVLAKGFLSPPVEFEVSVHREPLCDFLADGLIISTPTGSTAYALSAGGPIIPPHVECILLVPICAHALYSRPFVLGREDVITVRTRSRSSDVALSLDGQAGCLISPGSEIQFFIDPVHVIPTLDLRKHSYYSLLREKLNWGTCINNGRRRFCD